VTELRRDSCLVGASQVIKLGVEREAELPFFSGTNPPLYCPRPRSGCATLSLPRWCNCNFVGGHCL
jgi:hypothetical protein